MPQIDVTMQGVGRQFAKMSSEIETLLLEKQMLLERIEELEKKGVAAREVAKGILKKAPPVKKRVSKNK